jgi:hypothetical protein
MRPLFELAVHTYAASIYVYGCGFAVDSRGVWMQFSTTWPREGRWLVLFSFSLAHSPAMLAVRRRLIAWGCL